MESNWRFKAWEYGWPTGTILGGRQHGHPEFAISITQPFDGHVYFWTNNLGGNHTYAVIGTQVRTKAVAHFLLDFWIGED